MVTTKLAGGRARGTSRDGPGEREPPGNATAIGILRGRGGYWRARSARLLSSVGGWVLARR
eukprot:1917285-Alexandrium_andersonii.AAC.1